MIKGAKQQVRRQQRSARTEPLAVHLWQRAWAQEETVPKSTWGQGVGYDDVLGIEAVPQLATT